MKYTLKKKFHPNQVEEIGHVFTANWVTGIKYQFTSGSGETEGIASESIRPHEIALLIHAGFLELKKSTDWDMGFKKPQEQKIDLWEGYPNAYTKYWFLKIEGTEITVDDTSYEHDIIDRYRVNTKNCHRTKESAEEALRLLKSKYEIE